MLTLFLLFIALDEPSGSHATITPIPEGGVVHQSNFVLSVPEGAFYSSEEDVHHFFSLFGTPFIPNCVGVYYSSSGEWEFGVAVQYYGDVAFRPVPTNQIETLTQFLSTAHPLTLKTLEFPGQVLIPPTFNNEEQSFMYGISVDSGDLPGIFLKKIFFTGTEALVMSVKANEQSFDVHNATIMAILGSAKPNGPITANNAQSESTLSFYDLLGAQLSPPPAGSSQNSTPGAPEEPAFPLPALIGGLIGLVLLAVALFLKGRQRTEES